jgi:type IV pilus assembly protein PilF
MRPALSVDPSRRRRLWPFAWLCAVLLLGACAGAPTTKDTREPARAPTNEVADADKRAQVRLELAGLYFSRAQYATALEEVRLALAARPDLPEAHGLRGLILAAMGDVRPAEDSLRRAIQLAPGDGGAIHNYGWFLCQQRRWPEGEAQFKAALALPQYRDAQRTLLAQGVCQARAGRMLDAERTLSRSFELDPSNPVTAYNLADVLYQRGELERARFYVRRIQAVPELVSAQTLWLLARIENRMGNPAAARDLGAQLQERFPQSPEALQYQRGRFDD